ncbi:MAG: lipid A deacylase LpxR family protein, partial [Wenzhouxiangellaceae bacterium]
AGLAPSAAAAGSWSVNWANDEFFGSDNQFTNGFSLQRHGSVGSDWNEAESTVAFGRSLARRLLPQRGDLHYRESWSFGQNMQTPDNISTPDIILDDAPFVGMLGWTNTHIAFNDRRLTGFQTMIGLVGPLTQADELQREAHRLTGASNPRGWRNQLDNEPLLNLYAVYKVKIASGGWQDLAIGVDGALGNFFTHAQASLEWRIGKSRPLGFAPAVEPIGRAITYDARLRDAGRTYFYGTIALQGTALGFAMPREGNLLRNGNEWTDNNVLSPRRFLRRVMLGLHFERDRWAIHAQAFLPSDSFRDDQAADITDPKNNFGIITLEWGF